MSEVMEPRLDTAISGDDNLGGRFMNWNNSGSVLSSETASVSVARANMSEQVLNVENFAAALSTFEEMNAPLPCDLPKQEMWADQWMAPTAALVNKVTGSNLSGDDLSIVSIWNGSSAEIFVTTKEGLPSEKKAPENLKLSKIDIHQMMYLTNNVRNVVLLRQKKPALNQNTPA
ncbi:MAG: hypothetical protein WC521_05935 [Bdellovibrionales bacterium]|jgi:hypothetical protein